MKSVGEVAALCPCSADTRVMWRAAHGADSPIEARPQPHANRARGTTSATSRRALRYVDLHRSRRCFRPLLLPPCDPITPRRPFVRSANCGCVRPTLCASSSSFRAHSNRRGGRPCPCPGQGAQDFQRGHTQCFGQQEFRIQFSSSFS